METSGYTLVVGAGSGIGLETAFTFAERGARGVAFADKDAQAVREAAAKSRELATHAQYESLFIEVDVAQRDSVRAMVAEVKSKFGRIDYAVNCAGVPRLKEALLNDINEDEFDLLYAVNCKGALHCLQEEIEAMNTQEPHYVDGRSGRRSVGPGSITVVTSLSALIGSAKATTYVASKFAARGIIKCAALENRRQGLRINEICPGFTDTPMLRNAFKRDEKLKGLIDKAMPLGRSATVEEIAGVAHFLATPSASFINGESIVVDSGVSAAVHS